MNPSIVWPFLLLLIIDTCVSALDTRCRFVRNETFPKECPNFYIERQNERSYLLFEINPVLVNDTNHNISMVELDETCNCICNCKCDLRSPLKTSTLPMISDQRIPLEPGCYRLISIPHNLSSCCIYFPGSSEEIGVSSSHPSTPILDKTPPPSTHALSVLCVSFIGVICLLLLLFFFIIYFKRRTLHQHNGSNQIIRNDSNPSLSSSKDAHFLLMYAHKDTNFQNIVNCFINILEGAINECKVYSVHQFKEDVCEEGSLNWLIQKINKCSKVIVFLSPAVLDFQSKDNQIDNMGLFENLTYCFFSKLLLEPQCQKKTVFISLEIFGTLSPKHCVDCAVYTLPTKLEKLIKLLAPCTLDKEKIKQYQRDLDKEMSLIQR